MDTCKFLGSIEGSLLDDCKLILPERCAAGQLPLGCTHSKLMPSNKGFIRAPINVRMRPTTRLPISLCPTTNNGQKRTNQQCDACRPLMACAATSRAHKRFPLQLPALAQRNLQAFGGRYIPNTASSTISCKDSFKCVAGMSIRFAVKSSTRFLRVDSARKYEIQTTVTSGQRCLRSSSAVVFNGNPF